MLAACCGLHYSQFERASGTHIRGWQSHGACGWCGGEGRSKTVIKWILIILLSVTWLIQLCGHIRYFG